MAFDPKDLDQPSMTLDPLLMADAGTPDASPTPDAEPPPSDLDRKIQLLARSYDLEAEANGAEERGDMATAERLREQVRQLQAEADAIPVPDDPSDDGSGDPDPTAPAPDPSPTATGAVADSDGDGLSDAVERRLGTDVNKEDTDGDGTSDGGEVANSAMNPRVRDLRVTDPSDIAANEREDIHLQEQALGVDPGTDTDGDGFADWVEELRGSDRQVADLDPDQIANNRSPLDQFLHAAQSQTGKPYKFGAEADLDDPAGAAAFDSSELVQWAARQAGIEDMPDGSWLQYRHLDEQGATVPLQEALATKGALVFGFSSDPLASPDRPARAYVGISLGNGKVLDISERSGVVREMTPDGFYSYGAVIPQLHQSTGDMDGDGYSDDEEMRFGGDPSKGIPFQREGDIEIEDEAPPPEIDMDTDGDGDVDQDDERPAPPEIDMDTDGDGDVDQDDEIDPNADPVNPQGGPDPTSRVDPLGTDADLLGTDTATVEPRTAGLPGLADDSSGGVSDSDGELVDPRLASADVGPSGTATGFDDESGYGDSYGDTETYSDTYDDSFAES